MDRETNSSAAITSLLNAIEDGQPLAAQRLWDAVYAELRRMAHGRLAGERRGGDLQTTVLVQEAYLKLVGPTGAAVAANRRHFFAIAANAMRQIVVDDARHRKRLKRGGGRPVAALPNEVAGLETDPAEVLALDDALTRLRGHDARKADVVQLRYFGGLTIDETAEALGLSPRQVDKEWRFAKAWLHRELS